MQFHFRNVFSFFVRKNAGKKFFHHFYAEFEANFQAGEK